MKHLFFRSCLVFLAIITELNAVAGDYDVRTSVVDGVEWTYQVLSEANRTCQLGDGSRNAHNAVSHHESELLTTPAQIDGYYVVAISPYAFANDSKLRGITLSEGIDIIGYGAFYHAENLEGISFPNSLRTIEYYAFRGCKTLTGLQFPEGLEKIGENAFDGCNLVSVNIPASVNTIEASPFPRNPNLESISVAEGNSKYDSRKGCNALIETATNKIVQGCNNTVILDGIEIIGVIAFTECNGLNSIVLPATIRSIQGNAFLDCKNLLTVTCYAKEPYSISTNVFPKNTYTNGVLQVRKGSKELYEAKKPWSDFSNIVEIESPEIMSGDKFVADINGINLKYRVISTDDKTCVIGWPDDLHTPAIDPSSSGELRIPETINGYSVIEISDWSFYKCMNLTGIHIPASVRSFGTNTFLFCTGLTNITVALENKTFDSRENCNAIIHTSSNTLLLGCENTIIPNSVIVIGETAFFGCSGMTSVAIPIGVTEICQSAFAGCGISSLEIPEGVLSIGVGAFDNCKQLKEVTIPKSVISIGLQAFWACNALESVTSYIKNPFQIGDNTFATTSDGYDILPPIATLYVPEGTKSLYEQTPSWSLFPKIVEMSEEPIMKGDTNGDGTINSVDIVEIVKYLIGNKPNVLKEDAADINGDGVVNIADIVKLVSVIMGI
jgi:hypothetical protein